MKKRLLSLVFAMAASLAAFAVTPPDNRAPEIDASAAASAVTLLSGALVVLRSRRRS